MDCGFVVSSIEGRGVAGRRERPKLCNRPKHRRRGLTITCGEIHEAAKADDLALVERLLTKGGVSVDDRDKEGWTPLMWSARVGSLPIAELLHANGADLLAKNDKGSTALHQACHFKADEVVEKLLSWLDKDQGVNETNFVGWTPLFWAAKSQSPNIISKLLLAGSDPNAKNLYGATPLHEVTIMGNVECARLLLEAGALVDAPSDTGSTPLHTASYLGQEELVQLFLFYGANLSARDGEGATPLLSASRGGSYELVENFLSLGCMPNEVDHRGWTGLHEGCRWARDDVVDVLLDAGADVNSRTMKAETPLHLAAMYGASYGSNADILQTLVDAGADLFAVTEERMTAMDLLKAGEEGRVVKLVRLLEEAMAKSTLPSSSSRTP